MIVEGDEIVKEQILKAKRQGKHKTKIKTYQLKIDKNGKHNLYLVKGYFEGSSKVEELKEQGFDVKFEKTDKQATVGYDASGSVRKFLLSSFNTTNMIISWN